MILGFDAKRAFFNRSGLGNYSRSTINLLSENYPDNQYRIYSPSSRNAIDYKVNNNVEVCFPDTLLSKITPRLWRSSGITSQLKRDGVQLFHGLSNELPVGINKTNIASVVTIHDLIFLRYPDFYKSHDRKIYQSKFLSACIRADRIIAISEQTKVDIVELLGVDGAKIDVVYQGCDERFYKTETEQRKNEVSKKYALPQHYILSVGTIEERKNLLNVVKALHAHHIDIPLVIVGRETPYAGEVKSFIAENKVENVHFLSNVPMEDLPALYQMAEIFMYPSVFEGFGIPILEALNSKVPVVTSIGSCFPEAGGKSTAYINPSEPEEIAEAITRILSNSQLKQNMIIDGYLHAQQFRQDKVAQNLMRVYKKLIN